MPHFRRSRYIWPVLALTSLVFFACASGPATKDDTEMAKKFPGVKEVELTSLEAVQKMPPLSEKFANIVVRRFDTTDEYRKDYPEAVMQCKTALLSQLKSKNAYRTVTDDKAANLKGKTLLVDMEVVDMRIASAAARIWGGAFAGASYMKILTRLTDGATGRLLRERILSTTTNPFGAAWTMGASDRTLPMDFGQVIGEYLYTVAPGAG